MTAVPPLPKGIQFRFFRTGHGVFTPSLFPLKLETVLKAILLAFLCDFLLACSLFVFRSSVTGLLHLLIFNFLPFCCLFSAAQTREGGLAYSSHSVFNLLHFFLIYGGLRPPPPPLAASRLCAAVARAAASSAAAAAASCRDVALKFKASAPRLMNISVFVSLVCSLAACAPAMAATDNSPMLVETPVSPAIDPEWDLHFAVGLLSPLLRRHSASLFPSSSHLAGSVRTACPGQHRARPAGARAHRALFSRLFHASSRPLSRHMPCAASRSHSRILPSNTRARLAWPMTSSSAP